MEISKQVRLDINGQSHELTLDCRSTLNEVLRNRLGLFGTKLGCNYGGCGNCTVLMIGRPVYSCSILAVECEGVAINTIEGLSGEGELHPLQEAFADAYAAQCGWCTPGMIMAAGRQGPAGPQSRPHCAGRQDSPLRSPLSLYRLYGNRQGGLTGGQRHATASVKEVQINGTIL